MPATLSELASAIATYERLLSEVPITEQKFPPIGDQMVVLSMFKIISRLFITLLIFMPIHANNLSDYLTENVRTAAHHA